MLERINESMRYWIAILLTLICFRGVYAGDDISGSANLTYRSTETKTGEEEESSWGFTHNYNLQATKEFTSKINFAANLGINVNETNNTKTTLLTPDIRLNLRNEYFDADTGYRITEKGLDILTMVSDEDRLTTESWNANFSTKSEKYPKVRLRYNEDMNYDHLALRETDEKTTNFSGSADYAYRFLNFNYDYKNNVSDNYVTEFITETDTHEGRVNFSKSFWKNKITTSGTYSIANKKTEATTGGQEVEVAEKKTAYKGLYKEDTGDAINVTLVSTPALIDGKPQSTGINIGGGAANDDQNIGLDLTFSTEIEKIYLYTTTPDDNFNKNNFVWDVYSSADNVTWAPITAGADFDYDTNQERFEISFTKTSARYFKVVNDDNDSYDLFTTEIEAYSIRTQAAFTTAETEQITQTTQANLRFKPVDWLSFTYDFTQDELEKEEETDADSTKTRRSSHNISGRIEKEFTAHKYLKIRPEYHRRQEYEYDSEAETKDKATDTYLLHFLSSPLKTLDTDLLLNHTVSKEGGETQSKNSSALLQIAAKLRDGADLDVNGNITRSENPVSQSETTTKSVNSNLRLELTRKLTAEIEYNNNWTETENPDGSASGRSWNTKTTFYWRPSHEFYFRASCAMAGQDEGDKTLQMQYNMNWLMTEKMQLSMGHTLDEVVDKFDICELFDIYKNNTLKSTYSANLSWNLSRVFTLRFDYDWSRQKADMTETQTFTTNLSARF